MVLTKFDDSWRGWIQNTISNGTPKEDIFNILLNHGYDFDMICKELDIHPKDKKILDRKSTQLELNKESNVNLGVLYKPLADNPCVYRIENNNLEIYRIYNFLKQEECDLLIKEMGCDFSPSTITNPNADKYERTSSTCNMMLTNKIYENLNNKIHDLIKIPIEHGEVPQGQKYLVGQEFKSHTDYFHLNEEYNKKYVELNGQRTWTFMIYLNNVESGGSTKFSKIGKEFFPSVGDALIWKNILPDNSGNYNSLHCGMPVIKGSKIIVTKWFRER